MKFCREIDFGLRKISLDFGENGIRG